jgi:hypothetical protein
MRIDNIVILISLVCFVGVIVLYGRATKDRRTMYVEALRSKKRDA